MSRISERNIYTKQLEELYSQSKKSLTIDANLILSQMSDDELGKLVRDQYKKKVDDCDSHLKYMKSL
jgi:hypothetical protein